MSSKKTNKNKLPLAGPYVWDRNRLRDVDKSLYCLLQAMYELRLIPESALHHGTTCGTKLLVPIEEI